MTTAEFDVTVHALPPVVETIQKDANPKFATIFNLGFTYTEGGRWHTIEVNAHEFLEIMNSGFIDGRQICAVSLFHVDCDNAEDDKLQIIFDFMRKNTSRDPWRVV